MDCLSGSARLVVEGPGVGRCRLKGHFPGDRRARACQQLWASPAGLTAQCFCLMGAGAEGGRGLGQGPSLPLLS